MNPSVFLVYAAPAHLIRTGYSISNLVNLNPPLGLMSIGSYLQQRGLEVELFDFNACPEAVKGFRDALSRRRPQFVGISCTTSTFNGALMLAGMAREVLPETAIVFGGPHVSALRESVLDRFPVIVYRYG